MSPWLLLAIAICLEVAGTTMMKYSDGFEKVGPSIFMVLFYIASLVTLAFAVKKLDISVAYAIWSGLGVTLIAFIGAWVFGESLNALKLVFISLIVIGVVGLQITNS